MGEVGGGSGVSLSDVQALLVGKADASSVATAISTKADASAMPQPAASAPPSVADSSNLGNTMQNYALANHTHASKVRKERRTGVATATFAWTYPSPFTAGAIPIISAIVEDPSNSSSDSYNVQVVGTPTATGCQLRIIRSSTGLLSLLTGALSLNPTPGNVNLHLIALEP